MKFVWITVALLLFAPALFGQYYQSYTFTSSPPDPTQWDVDNWNVAISKIPVPDGTSNYEVKGTFQVSTFGSLI